MIVARLLVGRDGAVHRHQERIALSGADILALQGDRRRQCDVGMARRRRPHRILHDHGVRPAEGATQPAEILVVVERVAAGPIDQPDVGVGQALAVVIELFAGVQQQVGDARHRDEVGDAVAAYRHGRQRYRERRFAGIGDGAQRVGETAALQPDLAEHGG